MKITLDGFRLTLNRSKREDRLELLNPLDCQVDSSQFLFAQCGLMHLISPHFPKVVETNFVIDHYTQGMIEAMYRHHGHEVPIFHDRDTVPMPSPTFTIPAPAKRIVIAFSGGKDSLNNLRRAREECGVDNVLAVHISGLNRGVASAEEHACRLQAEKLGFRLEIVKLKNGSTHRGRDIMRSRDIFLSALIVPYAMQFGALQIITEGFYGDVRGYPFSGVPRGMAYFNNALRQWDVSPQVRWWNLSEIETMKQLCHGWPEAIPYIQNCFAPQHWKGGRRRAWLKRAPSIWKQLLASQCGSCVKCLTITLGRMLHDPEFRVTDEDRLEFFAYLARWISKHPSDRDIFVANQ